jgi:hypothetical protein
LVKLFGPYFCTIKHHMFKKNEKDQ